MRQPLLPFLLSLQSSPGYSSPSLFAGDEAGFFVFPIGNIYLCAISRFNMKTYKLEDLTDTYIGKEGTKNREAFDNELRLDLLGEAIKHTSITLPPAEIQ